jgi:hypothetical protein
MGEGIRRSGKKRIDIPPMIITQLIAGLLLSAAGMAIAFDACRGASKHQEPLAQIYTRGTMITVTTSDGSSSGTILVDEIFTVPVNPIPKTWSREWRPNYRRAWLSFPSPMDGGGLWFRPAE